MELSPGTRLGPYEITGQLGHGGMGEVYRARDTKLDRDVAVKVLPETFAASPERVARFEREAKTLASLNHPNIGAIYGLEDSDGTKALILELVEGPTLADRLQASGFGLPSGSGLKAQGSELPLDETLTIARQIAEALEAAHDKGVIHRDLKPANIKVKPDGTVKVLDFGLAKAYEAAGRQDQTVAPTLTSPAQTLQGVILGTAAYMSPEQAAGGEVDQRSDIWAFGVVLYEMLTGRRLFDGDSVARVIARVLERDLDFAALPAGTPPAVRRLLRRCLERDRRKRLHHIADARVEIDEALIGAPSAETVAVVAGEAQRRPVVGTLVWAVGALVLGALAAGVSVWMATRTEPEPLARFEITTPPGATPGTPFLGDVAVSPDGTHVVYASGVVAPLSGLHVRSTDQLETTPLRGAELGANSPFFSPDGQQVGFFDIRNQALKQVSVLGGPATTIAAAPGEGGNVLGADWGPDGTVVFGTQRSGLWRVPAVGGEPQRLTTVDDAGAQLGSHRWPEVLPNGDTVLFTIWGGSTADSRIAVVSLQTGEITELISGGSHPRYVSPGYVVYGVGGTLRAVGFDQDRLAVTGNPVPVVEGALTKENTGAAVFAEADNGSLVYLQGVAQGGAPRTLVWVDRTGREEPIDLPARAYEWARVSPDGSRFTVQVAEGDTSDIWVSSIARPALSRVTVDPASDSASLWTPDSRRVVFTSNRGGQNAIYWKSADGTGEAQRLVAIEEATILLSPEAWSADGRMLLFTYGGGSIRDLKIGSLAIENDAAGEWKTLIDRQTTTAMLAVSPEGRWFAYESNDSGNWEVFVERFPDLGGRTLVSGEGGGWAPLWAPNGRELFYRRRSDGAMMAVPIKSGDTLDFGQPVELFNGNYPFNRGVAPRNFDLTPDGERFLMLRDASGDSETSAPRLIIVERWAAELARLVSAD